MIQRFFIVDHGIDNYEDAVDLNEIIYYIASWSPQKGCSSEGSWNVKLLLRGGIEKEIGLSETGYKEFVACLKIVGENNA